LCLIALEPDVQRYTKPWTSRKGNHPCASPKESVLSTELRLREVKDKAAPREIFGGLDDFHGFLDGPAGAVRNSGRDRREWTKGS